MKEMLGGCCVCSDENGWQSNPLVYCDGPDCEVAVHQGCYGILEVPEGEWMCAKCQLASSTPATMPHLNGGSLRSPNAPKVDPRCELCPFSVGALKRTDKDSWAHVICALYIPEVRFGDVHSMDPVIIDDVPKERFERTCYLCEEDGVMKSAKIGACMNCNKSGCKKSFHVTCAQRKGLLCEEGGVSKNVKYCGYCSHHLKKAQQDPSIKVVPPCKVRPFSNPTSTASSFLSSSSISAIGNSFLVSSSTPSTSSASDDKMMIDQLSRVEPVSGATALSSADAALLQGGGSTTFSPPLTTSSRSSLTHDASTPPLKEGPVLNGHSHLPGPSSSSISTPPSVTTISPPSAPTVSSPSSTTNALPSTQSSLYSGNLNMPSTSSGQLTNHNRLDERAAQRESPPLSLIAPPSNMTAPLPNHHHHNVHPSVSGSLPVGAAIAAGLVTPKNGTHVPTKRSAKMEGEGGKPVKRQRHSTHKPANSVKALLDAVEPLVAETVSDFQRERAAEKERVRLEKNPFAISNRGMNNIASASMVDPLSSVGATPAAATLTGTGVPGTMEELLERQWEQGSNFLLSNSHFDVAQLLHCLHSLKKENVRLEEQMGVLSKRREHLMALNNRLSMPLGATAAHAVTQHATQPPLPPSSSSSLPAHTQAQMSLSSPHSISSPLALNTASQLPCGSVEDSLNQLRTLGRGNDRRTSNTERYSSPATSTYQRAHGVSTSSGMAFNAFPSALTSLSTSSANTQSPSFNAVSSLIPTSSQSNTSSPDLERLARELTNSSSPSISSLISNASARQALGAATSSSSAIDLLTLMFSQQQSSAAPSSSVYSNANAQALLRIFMGNGPTTSSAAK